MADSSAREAAETLTRGLGRRGFLRAAAAVGAVGAAATATACTADTPAATVSTSSPVLPFGGGVPILQPGEGDIPGDHYLRSEVDQVLWG